MDPIESHIMRRIAVRNSKLWASAACLSLALAAACGGGRKEEESSAGPAGAPGGAAVATTPFDPATGTAAVSGKVTFEGMAPTNAQIKMNADPVCMGLHKEPVYAEE